MKQSVSLISAPDQAERNHLLGKIASDIWLSLEKKVLLALIAELKRLEYKSFAAFDGTNWIKVVKIIGYGNDFLTFQLIGSKNFKLS